MEADEITKTPYKDVADTSGPSQQTFQYPSSEYPPQYSQQQYPMHHPSEYPQPEDSANSSHGVHVTSYQFPAPNSDTETLVHQDPPPNTCLVGALLATFLCFWPTGIVAIVYAAEARSAFARGDYLRGHANARKARTLVIASIITGSIILICVGVFFMILALLGLGFY